MSGCRFCGDRVRWVTTENDRRMALNLRPDPVGNVVLRGGRAHVLTQADRATGERFMPHAATCPYAGRSRSSRRKR